MKVCKVIVYAILPYLLLFLLWGIQIQKVVVNTTYDTKGMQNMTILTAIFLGLMIFVISHIQVDLKWKKIIGCIHAISFVLLSVFAYTSIMSFSNVFGKGEAFMMFLMMLTGNSPTLFAITIFLICEWIYTLYQARTKLMPKNTSSISKTKQAETKQHDTWLES